MDLSAKFIRGLKAYNLTPEDVENWEYCGGMNGSDLSPHFKKLKMYIAAHPEFIPPALTSKCVCGHNIKENCYISGGNRVLAIGNCCVEKFVNNGTHLSCTRCGEVIKRAVNVALCTECKKYKTCNCGKEYVGTSKKCPECKTLCACGKPCEGKARKCSDCKKHTCKCGALCEGTNKKCARCEKLTTCEYCKTPLIREVCGRWHTRKNHNTTQFSYSSYNNYYNRGYNNYYNRGYNNYYNRGYNNYYNQGYNTYTVTNYCTHEYTCSECEYTKHITNKCTICNTTFKALSETSKCDNCKAICTNPLCNLKCSSCIQRRNNWMPLHNSIKAPLNLIYPVGKYKNQNFIKVHVNNKDIPYISTILNNKDICFEYPNFINGIKLLRKYKKIYVPIFLEKKC